MALSMVTILWLHVLVSSDMTAVPLDSYTRLVSVRWYSGHTSRTRQRFRRRHRFACICQYAHLHVHVPHLAPVTGVPVRALCVVLAVSLETTLQ